MSPAFRRRPVSSTGTLSQAARAWPLVLALAAGASPSGLLAQTVSPPVLGESPAAPVLNSAMDAGLLYQLLVGEMALTQGDSATAFEWILDAARRSRDEGLFRRATDIALQARAGDQALGATRAWRLARPESLDALRMQMQILLALNKTEGLSAPLKTLLAQTSAAERAGLIAALPRFLQRANDPKLVAVLMEEALKPYRDDPRTRLPSRVALGRAWLEAKEPERALALASQGRDLEPDAPGPALLALELMGTLPKAETLVQDYLRRPDAEPALRQAYARVLSAAQRYPDAIAQLQTLTRQRPDVAGPYLSLGALELELKHLPQAEAALLRYVQLTQAAGSAQDQPGAAAGATQPMATAEPDDDDDDTPSRPGKGLINAWLMLAQVADQRGEIKAAEEWLAKVDDPDRALEVQSRRASLLAKQGKLSQARDLIRATPERNASDGRAKVMAEVGLLRDVKRWRDAYDLLASADKRFNDDSDLIYEQAMMAEKLERLEDMERLLRRVMVLKPESPHAMNALGYSLADRKLRLPEAKLLVEQALALSPGDPFITDSLGWVEFRLGNFAEAMRLLRQAHAARPDAEIATHLGEVLWSTGQKDEARKFLREAQERDAKNEVLRETLKRLRVDL